MRRELQNKKISDIKVSFLRKKERPGIMPPQQEQVISPYHLTDMLLLNF
jgi:hypothetical protein